MNLKEFFNIQIIFNGQNSKTNNGKNSNNFLTEKVQITI